MSEEKKLERQANELEWPAELEGVNNYGVLSGKLRGNFEHSHRFCGENYYKTKITLKRRSGTLDVISLVARETVIADLGKESKGKFVEVTGQICTFDVREKFYSDKEEHHLGVCFAVESITEVEQAKSENNIIYLRGQLCKPPYVKNKPSGVKVVEIFVAVRRDENRKDYIPCVCWKRNALRTETEFNVGSDIALRGRLQSRKYFKQDRSNPELGEYKTTYEVAIANLF